MKFMRNCPSCKEGLTAPGPPKFFHLSIDKVPWMCYTIITKGKEIIKMLTGFLLGFMFATALYAIIITVIERR